VRRLTPPECEGLQGFPKGWTLPEPHINLAENELDSLRYAALGNAVCVPVVEWIGKRIKKEWNRKATAEIAAADILTPFPTDRPKTHLQLGEVQGALGRFKWSSGGFAWKGDCILTSVSPSPVKPVTRLFADILEHRSVSEGHFLSPNAAEGILRRVRGQGRTLFAPLEQALQRLADSQVNSVRETEAPFPFMEQDLPLVFI
jgi:DNA (cytosine-5)-methyltransferase 1